MPYSFKIEGNSKDEITSKLKIRPEYSLNPYLVSMNTKEVRGFFGLGPKKIKYVAEYVIHEISTSKKHKIEMSKSTLEKKQQELYKNDALLRLNRLSANQKQPKSLESVVSDFEKIKKNIELLTLQSNQIMPKSVDSSDSVREPVMQEINGFENPVEKKTVTVSPQEEQFRQTLIEQEIEKDLVEILIRKIKKKSLSPQWDNVNTMQIELKKALDSILNIMPGIDVNNDIMKRVVVFIGPTGVGKTTSLVKCATDFYRAQKELRFFSNDSYRIGAPQQLETYANILKRPFEVCQKEEILEKFQSLSENEIVFFDTAGRSQKNKEQVNDLIEILKVINDANMKVETFLVVSATTKMSDLRDIAKRFRAIDYKGLVVTKTDETGTLGPIINLLYELKKPVCYFATGQDVPQDIRKADSSFIVNSIL